MKVTLVKSALTGFFKANMYKVEPNFEGFDYIIISFSGLDNFTAFIYGTDINGLETPDSTKRVKKVRPYDLGITSWPKNAFTFIIDKIILINSPAVCTKCKTPNEYLLPDSNYICTGCKLISDWAG